jgi:proton-coupled amino acid transporter
MICVTFMLAFMVPKIDLFIAFIGAVGCTTLSVIVPPILDLLVFWQLEGYSKQLLVKDLFILAFGVYIFLAGTYLSLHDILTYLFAN